ncbi:hypothetical protein EUGRSUZ_K00465 [Eucalyptus grandis]|uniref:Uncharacterized protein n=2 Tax=Eucalyptus grandis TaxID=71139 RepID=A0ACC3IQC0_EUCGR|nr:hypothetical protein EUGRSUZ_K00465 [Eucalyptus grandis]
MASTEARSERGSSGGAGAAGMRLRAKGESGETAVAETRRKPREQLGDQRCRGWSRGKGKPRRRRTVAFFLFSLFYFLPLSPVHSHVSLSEAPCSHC